MHFHWLYITSFLDLLATSLLVPFFAVYLHSLGLSRLSVGVFTSVYPTLQLFSSPAAGYCSDRYGQKQIFLFSLLLCSSVYLVLAFTSSLPVIFCCRLALGVFKHTQTLCKVTIVDFSSSDGISFSVLNAAEALGFMLGPIAGAQFMAMENGFQYLCRITTTIFVVNAALVYCFLPNKNYSFVCKTSTKIDNKLSKTCQKSSEINWDLLWDIFMLKWLLSISLSLFYTNYALNIIEQFKVSPSMIGYSNSFQGLISVVTGLISGKLTAFYYVNDFYYKKLYHCFTMLSFSFLCISFATNLFSFFVCLIPLSVSSTLFRIYTAEILLARLASQSRGYLIGAENTIASVAFLSSPFIYEVCLNVFGTFSISFLSFFISVVGAGYSAVLNFTRKN